MAWSAAAEVVATSDTSSSPWIWLLVGILVVLAIIVIARLLLRRRTPTPGGATARVQTGAGPAAAPDGSGDEESHAEKVLAAYGGFENITSVDACITRLRITVRDKTKVDKPRLKALGAAGVLEVGDNMQAIFGTRAEILKGEILEMPGAPR